jgi:hypothetical protein
MGSYVLDGGYDGTLEVGRRKFCQNRSIPSLPPSLRGHRYRHTKAMQAYLDWEYGLVEQLRRDGSHGSM